jgi:UDP-glucose 4-epimerase
MILLTGASGFIGKHLLKSLINQYGSSNILAFTSAPIKECPYLLHNNYKLSSDFFYKNNYATSIDTIIHAGAFIPKSAHEANDISACNSNIINTAALIENLPDTIQRLIFLSTIDVYAPTDFEINENSLVSPVSLYGQSKLYCEKMLEAWGKKNDKVVQILRIGHVYGPGEDAYKKIIPNTIRNIINKRPVQIWGSGNEIRSFIYVDDIIKTILESLKFKDNIGIVNIVSSQQITINALIEKLINIGRQVANIEMVQTKTAGINLIFNNSKMKELLLSSEILLDEGLFMEWQYMNELYR